MTQSIQLFLELELLVGREAEFERLMKEISAIVHEHDIALTYDFYRDPAAPSRIFAIETHRDLATLGQYMRVAASTLEEVRACTRPIRIVILGDLPPDMRATLEGDGALVIPNWLSV